jgi:Mg-chelatase subunit ChlD
LWTRPPAAAPPVVAAPLPQMPAATPRRRGGAHEVPDAATHHFADDEPVAPPPRPSASAAPAVLSLSLQASCARVAASAADAPVSALLTVRAPTAASAALSGAEAGARGGVDLVAVLDCSGSMSGEKIALLRATLLTAIELLTDADRLCLVSFESNATRRTPLARMTPAGKAAARDAVVALNADGGTDISEALRTAVAVMAQRRARNHVAGVLLLTDGEDSYGHGLRDMSATVRACVAAGATLSCFGYGAGHDARLMEGLAESGRGRFTFIERAACVRDAFGAALGGFFSTAAQSVSLALRPMGGAALGAVHAPGGRHTTPDACVTLDLEDVFEGETRDVLVELTLPAAAAASEGGVAYLAAELSWLPPGGGAEERVAAPTATLAVARPAAPAPPSEDEAAAGAATARALSLQRNRILAADATAAAVTTADGGGYEAAAAALRAAAASIVASPTGGDPFCAALAADLADTATRVGSRGAYASGGSAKARVSSKSHRTQRCNESDFASPSAMLYCSPVMLTTTARMRSTMEDADGGAAAAATPAAAPPPSAAPPPPRRAARAPVPPFMATDEDMQRMSMQAAGVALALRGVPAAEIAPLARWDRLRLLLTLSAADADGGAECFAMLSPPAIAP